MSHTFICTTGTSAAKLLVDSAGNRIGAQLRGWVNSFDDPDQAAQQIAAAFLDMKPVGEALGKSLSAEIHSLARMPLTSDDRVLLLSSETPDGLACAKAVALYLTWHWPGAEIKVEPVTGLQVDDAERFRRIGVVEYTKRCLREIKNYHVPIAGQPPNVILNPTGGFKALVHCLRCR